MTHKKFDPPKGDTYIPLQVGSALHEDLGYLRDDKGDNISLLNPYYAELTGMYYIWKNIKDADITGICHYRRYPVDGFNRAMSASEYEMILKSHDLITSKLIRLPNSYYYGFKQNHNILDLKAAIKAVRDLYPSDAELFERILDSDRTYFGNIFVTKKKLYDEYCSWLFPVFERVHKIRGKDIASYDDYHKRVYGFISEILLYVWVSANRFKAYECRIGMLSEKKETGDLKDRIDGFFKHKDIEGAGEYIKETLKKRPDLMMEASDPNGELRLLLEIIAMCDREDNRLLDMGLETEGLLQYVKAINRKVMCDMGKSDPSEWKRLNNNSGVMIGSEEDLSLLSKYPPTDTELEISKLLFNSAGEIPCL